MAELIVVKGRDIFNLRAQLKSLANSTEAHCEARFIRQYGQYMEERCVAAVNTRLRYTRIPRTHARTSVARDRGAQRGRWPEVFPAKQGHQAQHVHRLTDSLTHGHTGTLQFPCSLSVMFALTILQQIGARLEATSGPDGNQVFRVGRYLHL